MTITPEVREALKNYKKPFNVGIASDMVRDSDGRSVVFIYAEREAYDTIKMRPVTEYLAACLNEAAKEKKE